MRVSIAKTAAQYPAAPFDPFINYPEYPFSAQALSSTPNPTYDAVREALHLLGLDSANYGTPAWNPLRELAREGSRVIIKPNFVNHFNPLSSERSYFEALVTQAAVMRPIIDYLVIASRGSLTVTLADLPIQSADFDILSSQTGLDRMVECLLTRLHGRGTIQFLDLRDFRLVCDREGAIVDRKELPGDPGGYVTVDLGGDSSLVELERDARLFRAPDYDGRRTAEHHSGGSHRYILPKTILQSDLFINVPKLKVHRKVGVTLNLKNLVGIIGDKTCLPHWRAGAPEQGGDEFAVGTAVSALASRVDFPLRRMGRIVWTLAHPFGRALHRFNRWVHSHEPLAGVGCGDWHGNDTIWRMVHDLNRVLFFADAEGSLCDVPQRRYLSVVDGIVGGEGEGPLRPQPVHSGLIVAGRDPVAVDVVCSRLMGFDWHSIPQLARYDARHPRRFSDFSGVTADLEVYSTDASGRVPFDELRPVRRFRPSQGWLGHIELPVEPGGASMHQRVGGG